MSSDSPRPPRTAAPSRLLRAVHALRVAVRTAIVEWKGIERDEHAATISTNVKFRIEVEQDTLDGGFVASCVDLPGCYSQGETEDEAVSNLVEAISGVMEARMQRHLRQRPLHSSGEDPSSTRQPHKHTLELPVA